MAQTKTKRTGKNAPHCGHCEIFGGRSDHKETDKCWSWCSHCGRTGHHMSLCYKLKLCNLCGKAGHSPYRCWSYSTITKWICRARELDKCVDCLRPWKPFIQNNGHYIVCSHCGTVDINNVLKGIQYTKESQTEDTSLVHESQSELQQGKDLIDNQKRQIKELNSKILSLEDRLEGSNTTIDSLN